MVTHLLSFAVGFVCPQRPDGSKVLLDVTTYEFDLGEMFLLHDNTEGRKNQFKFRMLFEVSSVSGQLEACIARKEVEEVAFL